MVALSSLNFSELYEILIKILDERRVRKFMESVIMMSNDEMILKDWEIKQLDDLVEYQSLKHAKEDGIAEGMAEGIAEGKLSGIRENRLEIAKKMIEENADIDFISRVTGLTIKQIH